MSWGNKINHRKIARIRSDLPDDINKSGKELPPVGHPCGRVHVDAVLLHRFFYTLLYLFSSSSYVLLHTSSRGSRASSPFKQCPFVSGRSGTRPWAVTTGASNDTARRAQTMSSARILLLYTGPALLTPSRGQPTAIIRKKGMQGGAAARRSG